MPNGRPWTRQDINLLVDAATRGGDTSGLSAALGRTETAVLTKARRLALPIGCQNGQNGIR